MQTKAQPRGGIRLILTTSPYSPNKSEISSSATNLDKWPTHRVVLHTRKKKKKEDKNDNEKNKFTRRWKVITGKVLT